MLNLNMGENEDISIQMNNLDKDVGVLAQKVVPVAFLVDENCVVYLANKFSGGSVSQNLINGLKMSTKKYE